MIDIDGVAVESRGEGVCWSTHYAWGFCRQCGEAVPLVIDFQTTTADRSLMARCIDCETVTQVEGWRPWSEDFYGQL